MQYAPRVCTLVLFIFELTNISACEESEQASFFEKHLEELEKCKDQRPLFSRLNRHWNYLSPQFLYHLVGEFLSLTNAKEEMDTYEPPEGFSKIVAWFEPSMSQDQSVEDFIWQAL